MDIKNEQNRIKQVYTERNANIPADIYSYFNKGNLFIIQQREKAILNLLNEYGYNPLANAKILDVGCGSGGELRNFIQYGADPANLYGIDLIPERVQVANKLSPNLHIAEGSATALPFEDNSFDIVSQFTVFTSILDTEIKKKAAAEMLRVLKPNGIILWYDFRYLNPRNKHANPIKANEIKALFPDCNYDIRSITLIPPIARRLAPISWLLCYLLEKIPFMRSHYIAVIQKKS